MRSRRRKNAEKTIGRKWLYVMVAMLVLLAVTINCTLSGTLFEVEPADSVTSMDDQQNIEQVPLAESPAGISDELWADVSGAITTPVTAHTSPKNISLDVVDANLLDVLSLLACKLDVNIIFLGDSREVTLKTENLSPITTFQLILQKEELDYLVVGRNYIVASRDRLYDDFANRMLLSRYSLFYVSASAMEGYIGELGVDVQSFTVPTNEKAIWMQGTPMELGRARKVLNALDIMENAVFAEGGNRKIRMPVATASGARAEEELEALIDLLSILLDGFRDGRTDMGWATWDHPDPIPYIFMDWDSPIIKPYDIKMKITRDFNNNYSDQLRYLIAEGTPDNIDLVNQMIAVIRSTAASPLELSGIPEVESNITVVSPPPAGNPQSANLPAYYISLRAVPAEGGTLRGGGAYTQGSGVTVTAIPAEGFEFVRWIEDGYEMSTSTSYFFTVYNDRNLEAVFIRNLSGVEQNDNNEESAANLETE